MKKRFLLTAALAVLAWCAPAGAQEKIAFISRHTQVPNLYLIDPLTEDTQRVFAFELSDVLAYDFSADGRTLAIASANPVSEQRPGIKLSTTTYPFQNEKIEMTFLINSWDAVRGQYHLALDPSGTRVVCVDTFGTMLVDLQKGEKTYIWSHRKTAALGLCEAYQNWGGEFSPDGKRVCVQSFCAANVRRFDMYDFAAQEYRVVYEAPNMTGFTWLNDDSGILITASACNGSAGLYIADFLSGKPLTDLETCFLGSAGCNKYFTDFYSEFYLPQVYDNDNRLIVLAKGVKPDGTKLSDVYIIDQKSQVLTKVISDDFIELKLSPSHRWLAGIVDPRANRLEGRIYLFDFQTNQGRYLSREDSTCSQVSWVNSPDN